MLCLGDQSWLQTKTVAGPSREGVCGIRGFMSHAAMSLSGPIGEGPGTRPRGGSMVDAA